MYVLGVSDPPRDGGCLGFYEGDARETEKRGAPGGGGLGFLEAAAGDDSHPHASPKQLYEIRAILGPRCTKRPAHCLICYASVT